MKTLHPRCIPNDTVSEVQNALARDFDVHLAPDAKVFQFDVLIDMDPDRYAEYLAGPFHPLDYPHNELTVLISYVIHSTGHRYAQLIFRDCEGDYLSPNASDLPFKAGPYRL